MADLANLFRTGPNTFGGRYMRTLWHPIIIAAELKPGWAKPIQILGEKFTLCRGESGTPHLTAFRCAHRGLQLSVGWIEARSDGPRRRASVEEVVSLRSRHRQRGRVNRLS